MHILMTSTIYKHVELLQADYDKLRATIATNTNNTSKIDQKLTRTNLNLIESVLKSFEKYSPIYSCATQTDSRPNDQNDQNDQNNQNDQSAIDTLRDKVDGKELKKKNEKTTETTTQTNKNPLKSVDFDDVKRLYNALCLNNPTLTLRSIIKGSNFITPEMPVIVRSPELVERLKKLQFEAEKREYAKIVKNVELPSDDGKLIKPLELKEVSQQMSLVFGTLFSAVAVFACGYLLAQSVFPGNMALTVLVGLIGAFIALFAELWFIIKYSL